MARRAPPSSAPRPPDLSGDLQDSVALGRDHDADPALIRGEGVQAAGASRYALQFGLLRDAWPVLSGLLVLIGVLADEFVVAIVGAAIFTAGWLARGWARYVLDRLTVAQALSVTHGFVGETALYEVEIANRKILPVPWLDLRTALPEDFDPADRTLEPSGTPGIAFLHRRTSVRWYERVRWTYRLPLRRRGFYRLGATQLRAGDLFGVFIRERQDPIDLRLWVYPPLFPLERLGLPMLRPFGAQRGGNPLFEDPTRLREIRAYRPGDAMWQRQVGERIGHVDRTVWHQQACERDHQGGGD